MKGYSFGELVKLAEAALPRTDNAVSASKLFTARSIGGVSFDGTANINLPGVNQQGNQNTSGNAATATKLQTARTINGTNFDGTGNITTANWGTARTLTIGNTGKSVNGGANVAWSLAEMGALPLTGGTLTGGLTFSMDSELGWVRNSDYAKIGFKNTADNDTDSYMWFKTGDNGNEYFKWQGVSGSTITDWMALKSSGLAVAGTITAPTFSGALSGNAATATKLVTPRAINGTNFDGSVAITTANWGTARTLTIGNSGKSVNGGGNVAWTLAEIGAAPAVHAHTTDNLSDRATHMPEYASALGGTDLNALSTPAHAGFYYQPANADATPARNYPTQEAGSLLVQVAAGVTQQYITYGPSPKTYTRGFYSNAWSAWRMAYTTANKPTAADVGALPLSGGTLTGNLTAGVIKANNGVWDRGHLVYSPTNVPNLNAANGIHNVLYTDAYAVGAYMFAQNLTGKTVGVGGTVAGSALSPAAAGDRYQNGVTLPGTWRACGIAFDSGATVDNRSTLWVRIS